MRADRHKHTHMLLRPDVWDRMTPQRSHKWSLTLTRKSKQAVCLICPIQRILYKKKKKSSLGLSHWPHIRGGSRSGPILLCLAGITPSVKRTAHTDPCSQEPNWKDVLSSVADKKQPSEQC